MFRFVNKLELCATGDYWSLQPKLHDRLLPVQEHLPYTGSRRVSHQGPRCREQIADMIYDSMWWQKCHVLRRASTLLLSSIYIYWTIVLHFATINSTISR